MIIVISLIAYLHNGHRRLWIYMANFLRQVSKMGNRVIIIELEKYLCKNSDTLCLFVAISSHCLFFKKRTNLSKVILSFGSFLFSSFLVSSFMRSEKRLVKSYNFNPLDYSRHEYLRNINQLPCCLGKLWQSHVVLGHLLKLLRLDFELQRSLDEWFHMLSSHTKLTR